MRVDIFHYYSAPIEKVYDAYNLAIKKVFKKDSAESYLLELTFWLNFSFKYNMNGGECHVHFLSYNNGTVVDVHYVILQALGARYHAHDKDLTTEVEKILRVYATDIKIGVDEFQKQQSFFNTSNAPSLATSIENNQEVQKAKFCIKCGTPFSEAALFCSNCGAKRE